MDILWTAQISIPISQIVLLLGMSTLALIFGRIKLALIINYCFTLYWGYVSQMDVLASNGSVKLDKFTFAYFGFGLLILMLSVIGFVFHKD